MKHIPPSPFFFRKGLSAPSFSHRCTISDWWDGKSHEIGDVWKGPSGRWFTRRQSDGRVVPTKDPNAQTSSKKPAKPDKQNTGSHDSGIDGIRLEIDKVKSEGISKGALEGIVGKLSKLKMDDLRKLRDDMKGSKGGRSKEELVNKIKEAILSIKVKPKEELPKVEPIKPKEDPPKPVVNLDVPKIADSPFVPKAEKVEIDYKQKDPDNPVAKAIVQDVDAKRIVESMLQGMTEDMQEYKQLEIREKSTYERLKALKDAPATDRNANAEYRKVADEWLKMHKTLKANKENMAKQKLEARKKFVELMKPSNPVSLGKKNFDGIRSAVDGEWLFKPYEPTESEWKSIDEGTSFVTGIVNDNGIPDEYKEISYAKSRKGVASFSTGAHEVQKKDVPTWKRALGMGDREIRYAPRISLMGGEVTDYDFSVSTQVHELGHYLEAFKPGVKEKISEFIKYRFGDEPLVPMSTVPGGEGRSEMVRKDNFDRYFGNSIEAYYVGRDYTTNGKWNGTEILSMGIEALHNDPQGFINADPEYAQFIIGLLRM